MRRRHDTYLPQAPGCNMHRVRTGHENASGEIRGGTGKPLPQYLGSVALEKLTKFSGELEAASCVPLEEVLNIHAGSKGELAVEAAKLFSTHAGPVDDEETMRHASVAGCGVIVAYQDMIARMLAEKTGRSFNEDDYRLALKKSLPTLLIIAATSREADGALMTNAMNWSRQQVPDMNDEEIYEGLRIDESFFVMDDDGMVELRNDRATRKRIRMNGRKFDFSISKYDILFGCPFRSKIAQLYGVLGEAMIGHGFSAEAYEAALADG